MPNKSLTKNKDYRVLVTEVKGLMEKGLYTAYKAVDNIKVQTYWQIGERIVREELKNKDRAGYGKFLINHLAVDLGIHKRDLHRIVKLYKTYPIVTTLSSQLSWWIYIELCQVDNEDERKFYEKKVLQNAWSIRTLRKQIKAQLYEKTTPKEIQTTFQTKLATIEIPEVFKDAYDFDFLQLKISDKERTFENLIVKNIEEFLKEMGPDFSFSDRQAPIKIDDQTHYIDLVLFNKAIPCTVLIDLKINKINSNDMGQMTKYIRYYRQNRQFEYEKDAIGLILGTDIGKEEAYYTLGGIKEKIFVATYKAKLPSEDKIKEVLRSLN